MTFSHAELAEYRRRVLALPPGNAEIGLWDRFVVVPPILVRLLARRGNPPKLIHDEAILNYGLSPAELAGYSWSLLWDNIPVTRACIYLKACNVLLSDREAWNRTRQYMQRDKPNWSHLKNSPEWDRFEPMLKAWKHATVFAWGGR